ncbi:MAG: helix-hairpin-helix domain-containing protein [Patescibacteria group bacterium]
MRKITKNSGVIIIASFWILIILSALALSIAYRASVGLKLMQYYKNQIDAGIITKEAIRKFIELSENGEYAYNNPGCFKDIEINNGIFSIVAQEKDEVSGETIYGAEDEDGRININSPFITKEMLLKLPHITDDFAQDIIQYRSELKKGLSRIKNIEELFLLPSFNIQSLSTILEFMTVYGGGRVNINSAKKEVLTALGIDEMLADAIIAYRDNCPITDMEEVGLRNGKDYMTTESKCYRLNISVKAGKINKKTTVILEKGSYKIKYWNES